MEPRDPIFSSNADEPLPSYGAPPASDPTPSSSQPAVELIRQKLENLYAKEPSAKEELAEAKAAGKGRSKHQQFMYQLSRSGKSLAEIQTAWHNYYIGLPNDEKHQVWQEFYAEHARISRHHQAQPTTATSTVHHEAPIQTAARPATKSDKRTLPQIKQQLLGRLQSRQKVQGTHHLQSLVFGLGMGFLVLSILLFGFFNERFIAPFITPSRSVSSTPIIIDPTSTAVGPEAKIIIPKINVEIPVVYDEPSIEEAAVQRALEDGVVHYATTPNPGELGNGVIFGHSSNNILNKGKYKFAFVLLKRLENNDTFILQKDGKRYVYRVYDKKIVKPQEVSVLGNTSKAATFSLITCDPPGTSTNRLVVIGEQISPDPGLNVASSIKPNETAKPNILPSNAPSLWQRFKNWLTS